jgi:hypothetical protein
VFAIWIAATLLRGSDGARVHPDVDPRDALRLELSALVLYWFLAAAVWGSIACLRRWTKQTLLCLISVLMSIVAAELLLRGLSVTAAMPPLYGLSSERYHHAYPANQTMFSGYIDGAPAVVRTNEDGLRSRYGRDEFRRFKHRIVVMGDSFIFGLHVRQELALPALLESGLRSSLDTDDLAVLNAGIISYSPYLEKLQFDGILKSYEPTLAILMLDAGDIGDDYRYKGLAKDPDGDPRFFAYQERDALILPRMHLPMAYRPFGHHVAIFQLLASNDIAREWVLLPSGYPFVLLKHLVMSETAGDIGFDYYHFELEIGGVLENNRFFIYRHPPTVTIPFFDQTMKNIQSVADSAENIGCKFVLAVIPRYQHWNVGECPDDWEADKYARNEPYQFDYLRYFDGRAGDVDFHIYNMLADFQATTEFPLVFKHDAHWNERGHAFAARALVRRLLERELFAVEGAQPR